MSISTSSEARWLERLLGLKYYYVLKWQIRSTLALITAKIIDYNKKCFK